MKISKKFIIFTAVIISILLLFYYFDIGSKLSLAYVKEQSATFLDYARDHYLMTLGAYIGLTALVVAAGLPGAAILAILGGFLFGAWYGTLFSVIGAIIGSVMCYMAVKYVIHDFVRDRYGNQLARFQEQINAYGYSYILTLHFMTIIPFVLINALASLSQIPLSYFIIFTAIGSAPLFFVYALAGQELYAIQSVNDVFKPHIIAIFALLLLLALLPMIFKKIKRA